MVKTHLFGDGCQQLFRQIKKPMDFQFRQGYKLGSCENHFEMRYVTLGWNVPNKMLFFRIPRNPFPLALLKITLVWPAVQAVTVVCCICIHDLNIWKENPLCQHCCHGPFISWTTHAARFTRVTFSIKRNSRFSRFITFKGAWEKVLSHFTPVYSLQFYDDLDHPKQNLFF